MFYSFIWIYIFPILLISPFLTISMNSWFSIWMTLEFNLMAFIPLLIFLNKNYSEISMKYFIIQSLSSSILIWSSNIQLLNLKSMYIYFNIFMNLALFIKIGMMPFHSWFINLMNNMNWLSCFILSNWQKIAPLTLLSYNFNQTLTFWIIIYSTIFSTIYGINHQSIRLILSYSSINHLSWMILNFFINEKFWVIYFISYMLINASIMMILNHFNVMFLNNLFFLKNSNWMKIIIIFNLFSLNGMPPMFGFLMKWISLNSFVINNHFFITLTLLFSSILSFFFYTRICLNLTLLLKISNKMNLNFWIKTPNFNFILFCFMPSFINLWIFNTYIL